MRACSTDGRTVLHYIQSTDENAVRRFVSTGKAAWTRAVEDAAPPFQRHGVVGYQVYRGRYFTDDAQAPGCVVAVRREFDDPDPRRTRAWVDAMFAATGDAAPLPGMIAAHMHVSIDGSRVLNFAQWTSEQAHQALVSDTPQRMAANPALRRLEEAWPGAGTHHHAPLPPVPDRAGARRPLTGHATSRDLGPSSATGSAASARLDRSGRWIRSPFRPTMPR
ncbi:MAG: hypothetical protein GEU98_27770 [Pseudonocardiaceae bacterium]|nr:hypothetical protein [Pseudonocardiaceae bacterium]